jgi:hypothetical protein
VITPLIVTRLLIPVLTYLKNDSICLQMEIQIIFFCSGTIYESSGDRQKIVTVANLVKKCADTDELAEGLTVGPSLYYNRLLL